MLEVEARGVSFSIPDYTLELYLEAFGENKASKKAKVIWEQQKDEEGVMKATGTIKIWMILRQGTTIPVKNLLGGKSSL